MVGGAIAGGAVLEMLIGAAQRRTQRRMVWAGAGALLFVFLAVTEQRVTVWHDDLSLWKDTLRHNPQAYMGHYVLGTTFGDRGQHEEARRELESAVATCPRESTFGRERFCARYAVALGFARIETHDLPAAREAYALALSYADDYVPAIVGLGYVDLLQGNMAEARRHAERATDLSEDDPRGRDVLNNFRTLLHQVERDGPGVATLPSNSYGGVTTTASR
jgi:tetratricopeptide (TPR) repeat protein